MGYLETGNSSDEFLLDFSSITREHAIAVLELAKSALPTQAVRDA